PKPSPNDSPAASAFSRAVPRASLTRSRARSRLSTTASLASSSDSTFLLIVRSSPRLRAGRGLPTAGEVYVRFPHCTRRTRNPGDLRRPRRPLLHSRAMAHVTFLGACGTVTGSATLLTWGERNILLDCGMYQGPDDIEQR